ncbi:MAG: DUF167 domain-containing protein, partial [Desulfobacterales bacterium]
TAPPAAGAANKLCLKFMAKRLSAPHRLLEIISGHNSRTKHVLLRSEHTPASEKEKQRLKHKIEELIHN